MTSQTQPSNLPATHLSAFALYNLREASPLASLNADTQLPIASLTKIMTAVVVLENLPGTDLGSSAATPDSSAPAVSSDSPSGTDSSMSSVATTDSLLTPVTITAPMLADLAEWAVVGLQVGDTATIQDLLYALMLPSAGDAGQALAIATSGSIEQFVAQMNQKAAELGLAQTHFSNPIGRDEDNYSTASDLATLLLYAWQNPQFQELFTANEYYFAPLGKTITKTCDLVANQLTGAKTGFTYSAGRNLASIATRGNADYLMIALGADWDSTDHIADTLTIYDYYGENYGYQTLLTAGDALLTLPVISAQQENYTLVAPDFTYFLPNDASSWGLTYRFAGVERLARGAKVGDFLGTVTISQNDTEIFHQDFYLDEAIQFQPNWFLLIGGIVAILVAVGGLVLAKIRQGAKTRQGAKIGQASKTGHGAKSRRSKFFFLISIILLLFGAIALVASFWPESLGWQETIIDYDPANATDEAGLGSNSSSNSNLGSSPSQTSTSNYTLAWGPLMLINPNFTVTESWIATRSTQLVNLATTYGVVEVNSWNGAPRLDPEAAPHFAEMLQAYAAAYPNPSLSTMSCFRAVGTNCGRLCYATGTSDHHTGYTCDLIDTAYGSSLDTSQLAAHPEWTWLHNNSWQYGFIDRFIPEWAGGSMSEPVNVDATGTTGLYETWHFRYVGLAAASEIAHGVYNNGAYDSLEHYLKASGRVGDLLNR